MGTRGLFVSHFEDTEKGFLRNFHPAYIFHATFSFSLFFEELPFPRHVATIAFCNNVLTQSLDPLGSNHLSSNGCLDTDLKQLPGQNMEELV